MESNIKGLVSAGHEMASELKEECGAVDMRSVAKLIPERSSMLHRTDFHDDYQTVMAYKVSEVIAAIRAAGIRIKGE